jgi:hypothetical protein
MNQVQEPDLKYLRWMHILAFRCEFLVTPMGKNPLTKKGWGIIKSPKFWRLYNSIMTKLSKRHRETMYSLLDHYYNENKSMLN